MMEDNLKTNIQGQNPDKLMPHAPSDSARRGWNYYSTKDYSSAEDSFRQALQENPDDIDSLYALGMTLRYAGRSDAAVDVFRKVMDRSAEIQSGSRSRIVRRLALGHINQIEMGDWNLEKEVWSKKL
jgi:tetratricopeptide (TPR) repeat protein